MKTKQWIYPVTCLLIAASLTACGTNKAAPSRTAPHTTQVQNVDGVHPSRIVGWATTQGQTGHPTTHQAGYSTTHSAGYPTGHGAGHPAAPAAPHTSGAHQIAFDHKLADRVVHSADRVPGVEGATAIVRGNDIVVGITTRSTNQTITQKQVIEKQVYSAVHAIAPHHKIRITSDAKMVTRIRTLAQSVRGYGHEMTTGPTTVGSNLSNSVRDFGMLVRDLGRSVTAPFRK